MVEDYSELKDIALRILSRMPGGVGMVCGPITNGGALSGEAVKRNLEIIQRHIDSFERSEDVIFNQLIFEPAMWRLLKRAHLNCNDLLLNSFYLPLFESGKITALFFVPGWEQSYGARWERVQAERLGLRIHDVVPFGP